MGSQSFWLGDLVGPEGMAVLVGRADNSASLQVGQEESMGAILEVQVVGHLVGPGVGHCGPGHPMDPAVGHPMDLAVGHPMDPAVGHPMDPVVGHPMDPAVGRLVDLEVGRLEDQVVGSSHLGHQEVDPVGVDRLDRHESLGQSKTPG